MTIRVLLALLALVFCFKAEAKPVAVYGWGLKSCGAWTKAQAQRPELTTGGVQTLNTDSDADMVTQMEWVSGFISAFNMYKSATQNVAEGTDLNGVYAWIDNYSAAHPLDPITKAAEVLMRELSQRQ